eukprot:TRINITY_DN5479_c0_g1_i1.p1 TRINITY_DN5479_c0_g1~~TRINITY_DN5479_c0_g1_i1.p1  ORF type:complete len:615 (-),score=139.27 TRINITY_DN5479_c0_g1_i1:51-1895(-)
MQSKFKEAFNSVRSKLFPSQDNKKQEDRDSTVPSHPKKRRLIQDEDEDLNEQTKRVKEEPLFDTHQQPSKRRRIETDHSEKKASFAQTLLQPLQDLYTFLKTPSHQGNKRSSTHKRKSQMDRDVALPRNLPPEAPEIFPKLSEDQKGLGIGMMSPGLSPITTTRAQQPDQPDFSPVPSRVEPLGSPKISKLERSIDQLNLLEAKEKSKQVKPFQTWKEQGANQVRSATSARSTPKTPGASSFFLSPPASPSVMSPRSIDISTFSFHRTADPDYQRTQQRAAENLLNERKYLQKAIEEFAKEPPRPSPLSRRPQRSLSTSFVDLTTKESDLTYNFRSRLAEEKHKHALENIEKTRKELQKIAEQRRKEDQRLEKQVAKEIALRKLSESIPPLSSEEDEIVDEALDDDSDDERIVSEGFGIPIKKSDIYRLRPGEWLNDELVNFYMNILMERSEKKPDLPKIFAFNSFFYPLLERKYDYSRVRRWTKKADIFEMSRVIVPVHMGNHWCLGVINMEDKRFEYYDSFGGNNEKCLQLLRRYTADEHKAKKGKDLDLSDWENYTPKDIPMQKNGYDCGVFMCKFADYLSKGQGLIFSQKNMSYFRRRMVLDILAKTYSA